MRRSPTDHDLGVTRSTTPDPGWGGGRGIARALVPAILRLRRRFDRAGHPVIYANDNFMDWRGDFTHLVSACRALGGSAGEIARELAPQPRHFYLLKPRHSAFLDTPLRILLDELQVDRLVLTGISTDSCILATAQAAHMHGYPLAVPSDATAALNAGRRQRALRLLHESMQASIATAASVARKIR